MRNTNGIAVWKLILAPLGGLVFAVFLPAIGIGMTVYLGFRKLVPQWGLRYDPLYAYLMGRKKK